MIYLLLYLLAGTLFVHLIYFNPAGQMIIRQEIDCGSTTEGDMAKMFVLTAVFWPVFFIFALYFFFNRNDNGNNRPGSTT